MMFCIGGWKELKSTSLFDVKAMIDLLMDDYQLFTLQYLPNFHFHPPTPMLFANSPNNIPGPILYRNIWSQCCREHKSAHTNQTGCTLFRPRTNAEGCVQPTDWQVHWFKYIFSIFPFPCQQWNTN